MPRKARPIELHGPVGGLDRRQGFQNQPPYTTPDASNMRPFDPLEGRERCGSRPGLAKSFAAAPAQPFGGVWMKDNYAFRSSIALVENAVAGWTIGLWIKLDDATLTGGLLVKYSAVGGQAAPEHDDWSLTYDGTNFVFSVTDSVTDLATSVAAASFGTPTAGQWCLVIASWDNASNGINIQVNDGTIDTVAFSGATKDAVTTLALATYREVGGYGAANTIQGVLDGVFFDPTQWSAAERTWTYNSGYGRMFSEFGAVGTDGEFLLFDNGVYYDFEDPDDLGADSEGAQDLTFFTSVSAALLAVSGKGGNGSAVQSLVAVTVVDDDGTIWDSLAVVASEGQVRYTDSTGTFQSPSAETILIDRNTLNGRFDDWTINSNSLTNGGFETAGGGGADIWGTWVETAGDGSLANETSLVRSGSDAAKFVSGATGNTKIVQTKTGLTAGRIYRLTLWTRVLYVSDTEARYYVYDNDNAGYIVASGTGTGVVSQTYKKVSVEFTTPAGCTSIDIGLQCSATNADTAYFDDVELVELPTDVDSWTEVQSTGILRAETTIRYSGAYSVYLAYPIAGGQSYIYQNVTVTAAAECTLSFKTYCGDGVNPMQYRIYDVSNTAEILAATNVDSTEVGWVKQYVDFTVPAGCTSVGIYFYSAGAVGFSYVDDVELTHRVSTTTSILPDSNSISGAGLLQNFYFADSLAADQTGTKGIVSSGVLSDPDVSDWSALSLSTDTDYVVIALAVIPELYETSRSLKDIKTDSVTLKGGALDEGPVVFDIARKDHSGTAMKYHGYILVADVQRYAFSASGEVTDWTEMGILVGDAVELIFVRSDNSESVTWNMNVSYVDQSFLCLDSPITGAQYTGNQDITWQITRPDSEDFDGTIGANNELTSLAVSDWTTEGVSEAEDTIALNRDEQGFAGGKFKITSIAAGGLTLDIPADTTVPDGSDYLWQVGRAIQVLDPKTGVMGPMIDTAGVSPLDVTLLASWRGRLVAVSGNTWFMPRIGVPTDWDYGADEEDITRAMAGGVGETGDVPDPITALVPFTDDHLAFGASSSIFFMRGDPAGGGVIDPLSDKVGIISPSAQCRLPDGGLLFLSQGGLYVLAPGGSSYPVPFSSEIVPNELININASTNVVSMEYDVAAQGAHLFITSTEGASADHWWIDWRLKGVWPVTVPSDMQPFAMLAHAADTTESRRVILGCFDGFLREFSSSATDDDGIAIASYVKIGPVRLARGDYDGIISSISATLDDQSNDVAWQIRMGPTGEIASGASADASGTWSGGWNSMEAVRVRDAVTVIYVSNSDAPWAMETINLAVTPGGIRR